MTPTEGTVTVHAGGRQIARSTAALTLQESTYPGVQYIPLADVDPEVLRVSASHTYCPYKGDASYFDLVVEGAESADTVWVYHAPYDAVAEIEDHVPFYADRVTIAVDR